MTSSRAARDHRLRVVNVVGARPNFVKAAALFTAYRGHDWIEPVLVHTGQHYDEAMSAGFFGDLGLPSPAVNMKVGSGSHAKQTAEIMTAFDAVVLEMRPDVVVVFGDVNSTIACGLVAAKRGVPLAHVEAGLRSGDRTMPEEINRILTDAISDLLFCTEDAAVANLTREGVPADRVFLVGNTMIDTLLHCRERSTASSVLQELDLKTADENGTGYAVATLHRPSNVDDRRALTGILDALEELRADLPIVLPLHPRLRKTLARFGLERRIATSGLRTTEPFGYLDFLKLVDNARVVLTDSGGLQEETTALCVPCVTLRENTERPVTIEAGTNRLAGTTPERIVAACREALVCVVPGRDSLAKAPASDDDAHSAELSAPPLWDGHAAARIVAVLKEKLT